MLHSSGAPENLGREALLLACSFSIGFPKKTMTLLPMNAGKEELLIFNSSNFEVACLRVQYVNRRKLASRLLMLFSSDMHLIVMLTDF